jgi:hypothetical protein
MQPLKSSRLPSYAVGPMLYTQLNSTLDAHHSCLVDPTVAQAHEACVSISCGISEMETNKFRRQSISL